VDLKILFKRSAMQVGMRYLLTRELISTGAAFDPFDKRYYSDPYSLYARLRERDPFHRSRLFDGWVLTRYDDITAVLKDARFSADDRKRSDFNVQRENMMRSGVAEADEEQTPSMLRMDPPDHTRLRSLVNRAFTPRAVEALRARAEAIVAENLDESASRGSMDVIRDLAYPLPVIIIAEMLGVPAEDREKFKHWSDEAVMQLGFSNDYDTLRRSRAAGQELQEYFESIAEERRKQPRDDLLSALLAAEQEGDRLTAKEVMVTCQLLLVAGNETTTNLIGNGLLALMKQPAKLREFREDASITETAIEELLRFDSPVQATSRIPLEDMEFRGHDFRRGQQVMLLLGAGNRDPDQFPEPDRMDLRREENRHLSFSQGIHYCLGAPLARLEGAIALRALVERFPDMRLASRKEDWGSNFVLKGLKSLPVDLGVPARSLPVAAPVTSSAS
jgi:pimeloyl-[acyl-carrier protein] synthase